MTTAAVFPFDDDDSFEMYCDQGTFPPGDELSGDVSVRHRWIEGIGGPMIETTISPPFEGEATSSR